MSTFDLQCPICRSGIQIPIQFVGQTMPCPNCTQEILIPSDLGDAVSTQASELEEQQETLTAGCTSCHQQFGVTSEMAGQEVGCPFCNAIIRLPEKAQNALTTATQPQLESESEVNESELYAPGFAPEESEPVTQPLDSLVGDDGQNIVHTDHTAQAPPEIVDDVVEAEPVDKYDTHAELVDADIVDEPTTKSDFQLSEIDHPLLPPKFVSRSVSDLTSSHSQSETKIYLPTASGTVQEIDSGVVGIQTRAGRVVIRALPKETKESRRRLRSLIVYSLCAIVLIVVLFLLMRAK